jgi:hypothetical protein
MKDGADVTTPIERAVCSSPKTSLYFNWLAGNIHGKAGSAAGDALLEAPGIPAWPAVILAMSRDSVGAVRYLLTSWTVS